MPVRNIRTTLDNPNNHNTMKVIAFPNERSDVDEALMYMFQIGAITRRDLLACYGCVGWDFLGVFGITKAFINNLRYQQP